MDNCGERGTRHSQRKAATFRSLHTRYFKHGERYAEVLVSIAAITGKNLKRLFIVGGGSKNTLLNRLAAERSGLEVLLGSPESATLGKFRRPDGGVAGKLE